MTKKGTICYHINSQCNQRCIYCFRYRDITELSDDKKYIIIQGLSDINVENICWTGGEPMLTSSIIQILHFSSQCNINNRLITNASLLNSDVLVELSTSLYDLNITLDSIDSDINQKIGRGTTHYENVNNMIRMANELNLRTCINTVVTNINKDYLVDLANYLNSTNIVEWRLFRFNPMRGIALKNLMLSVTDGEYENIVCELKSIFKQVVTKKDHSDFNRVNILPNGEVIFTKYGDPNISLGNAASRNFDWNTVKDLLTE